MGHVLHTRRAENIFGIHWIPRDVSGKANEERREEEKKKTMKN